MTRALAVEWLRLRSRRTVWWLAALGLAGVIAVLAGTILTAMPPSAADLAAAQSQVDQQIADPAFVEQLQQCRADVAAGGTGNWPAGMNCDDMLPKREWFLNWSPPDFVGLLGRNTAAVVALLAVAMLVIAVVFAGADWSAGTIGTQLLFQPRRTQVFASKATVLAGVGLVAGTVGVALAWAVSYWVAARWGTTAMVESGGYSGGQVTVGTADLVGRALRAVIAITCAGLGGFALAMLLRGTTLPLAVVAAYALVAETIARGFGIEATWPYLLSTRVQAWLQGPAELPVYPDNCSLGPCDPRIISVGTAGGGIFLAVLLAAVVGASLWSFHRRDVS